MFTYALSDRRHKKLKVRVPAGDGFRWVHFGDSRYKHYHDRTGLLPAAQSHGDATRREAYLRRARGIKNKSGRLTADDPMSANYHAIRVLW